MEESTSRGRRLRAAIILKLGSECKRCGFNDPRALQVDHVNGGGNKELNNGRGGGLAYYYRVLRDISGAYQLLCANCNWIKRAENNESQGARQHRQPFKMKRTPKPKGYKLKREPLAVPVNPDRFTFSEDLM